MSTAPHLEIELAFVATAFTRAEEQWRRSPDRMLRAVEATDVLLRKELLRCGGGAELRRTAADGFLFAFDTLAAAIAFCDRALRSLAKVDGDVALGLSFGRSFVRVSPTGRVLDALGSVPSRACRLAAAGESRSVAVDAVVEALLSAHPVGTRLCWTRPPAGAGDAFFGRSTELAALAVNLRDAPLIVIVGPGGVGKTRLARELVAIEEERLSAVGGRSFWVDLSSCRTATELQEEIAIALSLQLALDATFEEITTRIGCALATKCPALLVLDNFEQLDDSAAQLVEGWIGATPGLAVRVTSRRRLGLAAERSLELAPLSEGDAVQLLEARLRHAGVAVETHDRPLLVDVVRRLDAFPLSLELAAGRARGKPLASLHALLAQDATAIASGREPRRGRTLRENVEWSRELLSPGARGALDRATVFRGGFSVEAAEHVLHEDPARAVALLEELVAHSLVHSRSVNGSSRFGIYQPIRDVIDARARAARRSAEAAHARYYAAAAERWMAEAKAEREAEMLGRIALEHDNLAAAIDRCAARAPEIAARALLALRVHAATHGPLPPVIRRIDAVLAAVVDRDVRSRLLLMRSEALHSLARLPEAITDGQRALDEAATDEPRTHALAWLCLLRNASGEFDLARGFGAEALAMATRRGDGMGMAIAEGRLGYGAHGAHGLARARAHYERSLALHLEHGSRSASFVDRRNKALLDAWEDRRAEAREQLHALLDELKDLPNPRQETFVHSHLVLVELEDGNASLAGIHAERALAKAVETSDRRMEGLVCGQLAFIAYEEDDLARAESWFVRMMDIATSADHRFMFACGGGGLALVRATRGDKPSALRALDAAYASYPNKTDHAVAIRHLIAGALELDLSAPPDASTSVPAVHLPRPFDAQYGWRLFRRALQLRRERASERGLAFDDTAHVVVRGRQLKLHDREWVELTPLLARVFRLLLEKRKAAAGQVCSIDELLAAGWPGETLSPAQGKNRLHVALSALRKLGLGDALRKRGGGYLLDPAIRIVIEAPVACEPAALWSR